MEKEKKNKIKRYFLYIIGLAILSFGVVLNIKTAYGMSPVNSVPYCISVITGIEWGNSNIICFIVYIGIEMVLMKKNKEFQYKVLLQLPFGIIFGKFITLFNQLSDFQPERHSIRIILLLLAVFLTALGIVITVRTKIVLLPPDGLVYEIAKTVKKDFGITKIFFDIGAAILTLAISFIFAGRIIGIGAGTIFCAIFIGATARWINAKADKFLK